MRKSVFWRETSKNKSWSSLWSVSNRRRTRRRPLIKITAIVIEAQREAARVGIITSPSWFQRTRIVSTIRAMATLLSVPSVVLTRIITRDFIDYTTAEPFMRTVYQTNSVTPSRRLRPRRIPSKNVNDQTISKIITVLIFRQWPTWSLIKTPWQTKRIRSGASHLTRLYRNSITRIYRRSRS